MNKKLGIVFIICGKYTNKRANIKGLRKEKPAFIFRGTILFSASEVYSWHSHKYTNKRAKTYQACLNIFFTASESRL